MHIFNTKKVGHTGTLDPIATGVLVITIGRFTKLGDALISTEKEYIATMELGYETDTLDNTGTILKSNNKSLSEKQIKEAIYSMKGEYDQEVPAYSAVKINGKKLYEYARNNESIELPKRRVNIKEIEVLEINGNIVKFKTTVSKGTYIRSLIRDIAYKLETYASMTDLIRTKQGKFNIEEAYTVSDIRNGNYNLKEEADALDIEELNIDQELYKKRFNYEFYLFMVNLFIYSNYLKEKPAKIKMISKVHLIFLFVLFSSKVKVLSSFSSSLSLSLVFFNFEDFSTFLLS